MPTKPYIDNAKTACDKAISYLKSEFNQLQAGRANPVMIENIMVNAYGTPSPLKNNAAISTPTPQSFAIQAWDKSLISSIEKAIRDSDLSLSPVYDEANGVIRIELPQLTEDRRRELVKMVHAKAEEAKIQIRKARHDGQHSVRQLEGISEDLIKQAEETLDENSKNITKEIETMTKEKEAEVMKV